jgi:hypothetical protein
MEAGGRQELQSRRKKTQNRVARASPRRCVPNMFDSLVGLSVGLGQQLKFK